MSMFGNSNFSPGFGAARPISLDYGTGSDVAVLAKFFNAVYAWMFAGLALTAAVAWYVSDHPRVIQLLFSGPIWVLFIAQLALVWVVSGAVHRIGPGVATALFLLYAAINGALFSVFFYVYTTGTLVGTFLACAAMFGAMSVWGMVSRHNLSRMGGYLFGALIGVIAASLVNYFMHSHVLDWIISYVGVVLFMGLTAYDTYRLRQIALSTSGDARLSARMAISGALALYLDFINLFLMLLRVMGNQRSR